MFSIIKLIRTFLCSFYYEYVRMGLIIYLFNSIKNWYNTTKFVYYNEDSSIVFNIYSFIHYNIKKRYVRLKVILFRDQTTSTRFFFGLVCLGLSSFFLLGSNLSDSSSEYRLMIDLLPRWIWALGYFISGVSLIYGVMEEKFNFYLLLTEGLLNVLVWGVSAYYISIAQGIPGAHIIGFIMALWLYLRYPTHKMKSDSYYRRKLDNVDWIQNKRTRRKGGSV